jgi:hypothetical protein
MIMDWKDITEQVRLAAQAIPEDGLLCSQKFSLEDSMGATELGPPKIDYRARFTEEDCPHLRPPPPGDPESVLALLLGKMMLWLRGECLTNTVYSTPHIYLTAFPELDFFKAIGQEIVALIRSSTMVKDDNYSAALVGFEEVDHRSIVLPKTNLGKFLRAFHNLVLELAKKQPVKQHPEVLKTLETMKKRWAALKP